MNDYRNIVVAEAMKVLGFVNRHSRGVLRVQKELIANENGEAIYDFGYQTAVLVREKKSKKGTKIKVPVFPSKIVEDVFKALKLNPKAKYSWLADNLGVSERTVQRSIDDLKKIGYINPEHSKIKGVWQLLK
ncbi:MAG: HTH domain-containing protein [Fibrobacter sp.]|nr:HTH domain-containing protein [Fibrobacter sp.]